MPLDVRSAHRDGCHGEHWSIPFVEVPAEGDYLPLYNPGGPGPEPFPGVRYTAPGPPDLEPVINALDDPMRVSNIPYGSTRGHPRPEHPKSASELVKRCDFRNEWSLVDN